MALLNPNCLPKDLSLNNTVKLIFILLTVHHADETSIDRYVRDTQTTPKQQRYTLRFFSS